MPTTMLRNAAGQMPETIHPQQYGRWPYAFLIKDKNIPSSTLNRLNQALVLNERERSYLLGTLFYECIKYT